MTALSGIIIVNAQGRRKDQSSINVEYGYIPQKGDLKSGYTAKAGYGRVFGEKGFLGKAEVLYSDYSVNYLDKQILPYQNYGINVNAGYSYEGLYPVMLNAWVGAFGSYENVNKGSDKDLLYDATIPYKVKGFSYGFSGSAEAEIYLLRRLTLLLNYSQYYNLKSDFSKSNYTVGGGLRFYIN